MRSPSMSSTHSSHLGSPGISSVSADFATVRQIVSERTGRQWCLFLDRDGVINRRVVGDYVRTWRDFEWLPGVPAALKLLRAWAPHVVVVTNQQGVGKGLMSADDVATIHRCMNSELAPQGVLIDAFQVCPHLVAADCGCRKPGTGLVLDWLAQHPGVEPSLSVVVGDSPSDMELASNLAVATGGCASIRISGPYGTADATFDTLVEFAAAVGRAREESDVSCTD